MKSPPQDMSGSIRNTGRKKSLASEPWTVSTVREGTSLLENMPCAVQEEVQLEVKERESIPVAEGGARHTRGQSSDGSLGSSLPPSPHVCCFVMSKVTPVCILVVICPGACTAVNNTKPQSRGQWAVPTPGSRRLWTGGMHRA